MIETNIRIAAPGRNLTLKTRVIDVSGTHVTPERLEQACNQLRSRHVAAVASHKHGTLLVSSGVRFRNMEVAREDWQLELSDSGRIEELSFGDDGSRLMMARLLERECQVVFSRSNNYWTLDSPRIFYQDRPFAEKDGVRAYRRFELSGIPIDGVGIGIVVDVSTGFFSSRTLAEYFPNDVSDSERQRLRREFDRITRRQEEQKGTLSYDLKNKIRKCYFQETLPGVTCSTTEKLRFSGETYESLHDYYEKKQKQAGVLADDEVVKVSFPNMAPVPVAAKLLRVRVMNDQLPRSLKDTGVMSPCQRRSLIATCWTQTELTKRVPLLDGFWRPSDSHLIRVAPRVLRFGGKATLDAPFERSHRQYKDYYRSRLRYLRENKCLSVPPAMARGIQLAAPKSMPDGAVAQFAKDMGAQLSEWSGKAVSFLEPVRYDHYEDAIRELSTKEPGVVVFVFHDESPETYFNVSHDLKGWRVKRVTVRTLQKKFDSRTGDNRPNHRNGSRQNGRNGRGRNRDPLSGWRSFVDMCSLDVLQQLGCVPWATGGSHPYDARLAVDVGKDKRHFALSLVLCGEDQDETRFSVDTYVENKVDWKRETINRRILCDAIVRLFKKVERKRGSMTWLNRLLIPRDGRKCGEELEGVRDAVEQLIEQKVLDETVAFDFVDVHKESAKGIRLWEVDERDKAENTFEGTGLILDSKTLVLQNTGAGTLRNGTAEPMLVIAHDDDIDLREIADTLHNGAQHNFSSPGVAQSLPIELKRTDDELKTRYSQEIRRVY